jgi:DUF4097 and DUF4098 domain-containing protein YvlB
MKRHRRIAPSFSPHSVLPPLAVALLVAALTVAAPPAAAKDLCGDDKASMNFGTRGETVRDFQEIHEKAPGGTWHIDAGEIGGVRLSDWDRNEVMICAQVTAWSRDKARAERLLRSIHVETSGGRLRAEGPPQSDNARWGVSYKILVPRSIDLDVQAVNGPVSVEGVRGRMTLRTENGPLQITNAGGDIEGRTTNGPLTVTLTGARWQGQGLDVETTNGPVKLSIPDGYSAELTTGTENGPMAGAFVGSSRGHRRRHISMVLGSGGAPIRVVTTNGPVIVNKGDDQGDDD